MLAATPAMNLLKRKSVVDGSLDSWSLEDLVLVHLVKMDVVDVAGAKESLTDCIKVDAAVAEFPILGW